MSSPVSGLLIFLCLVLGLTVSLVWGQTPTGFRIGDYDTVVPGSTIPMTNVGPGGPGDRGLGLTPLLCFTTSPSTAVWLFPDGSIVPLATQVSFTAPPYTIQSRVQGGLISLHRGEGFIAPAGQYCCGSETNMNERLCVTLASCPLLVLGNGMVTYTDPPVDNAHNSFTATHTCSNGYQLVGDSIRICDIIPGGTGIWRGADRTCNRCGPPPSITNGSPGTPTSTTLGGTVTYSCNSGYILSGSPTVACLSSGDWSTRPTCTATCTDLTPLSNGAITYSPTSSPRLQGTTATHRCNTGYDLSGGTMRTCQSDRAWSGGSITCPIVVCSAPPTIGGGSRAFTTTTYQSIAEYTCNNGYILSGSATVSCLASGSWSTRPTCTATCPDLSLTNGAITYNPTSSPRLQGTTATHNCNSGYELSGGTVNPRVCQSDRTWSGGSITCLIVDCSTPPTIDGGSRTFTTTTYQSNAVYSCNNGYSLSGSPTVTCLASGSWSNRPICSATCADLPPPENGTITYSPGTMPRRDGDRAIHACDSGYQRSAGAVRTCQSDTTWSGGDVTCLAICSDLPPLTNGGSINYSPSTTPRLEGATATYSCTDGYQLYNDITRTCEDSVTGGRWNGMEPTCLAITVEVVLPGDPPAAGQSYSLMCTVTGADSLNSTINYMYQWFKTTPSRTQVETNSPSLTFDPLVLSDTGHYNCEVTVSSNQLSQDVLITSSNYEIMFSTLNIQLRFAGVPDCGQYSLLDPNLKRDDITTGLTQGVESLCGCGFNTSFVFNPFLQCFDEDSPKHVTYRAVLVETSQATTVELVSYIKQWIQNTQRVVVQSFALGINTTCPVVIVDFNSPECPEAIDVRSTSPPPIDPVSSDIGSIIGGVVAGVFVLVVIVAAVIVIVLLVVRQRRIGSTDVQTNKTKVESQAVALSEINQPSLSGPTHPQQYETVGTEGHDYEDLGKFQEGENYEQIGQPRPPKGNYEFTSCPAYAPPDVSGGRGRATPTTGAQEHGHM